MQYLLILILTLVTVPIWGGALSAIVGGFFYLLATNPLMWVLAVGALFLLAASKG